MGSAFGAIGSIGGALIGLSDETTKHTIERIDDALDTLRNSQACNLPLHGRVQF